MIGCWWLCGGVWWLWVDRWMFMVIGDLGLLCELLGLLLGGSVDYGCVVVLAANG